MSKRKKTKYTVMFIPDDNGKTYSLRASKGIIRSLLFFVIVFCVGIAALLFKTGEIGAKLQIVQFLKRENTRLKEENSKLLVVRNKIDTMEKMSSYILRVAGAAGDAFVGTIPAKVMNSREEDVFGRDSLDIYVDGIGLDRKEGLVDSAHGEGKAAYKLGAFSGILPVQGWITRKFTKSEEDPSANHLGVDFAAAEGSLVRASQSGIVDKVEQDKYFGLIITLSHKGGYATRYGHCSQILVSEGDIVENGQTIALVGNTGQSSGPHLHFELLKDGKQVDPMKYIISKSLYYQ